MLPAPPSTGAANKTGLNLSEQSPTQLIRKSQEHYGEREQYSIAPGTLAKRHICLICTKKFTQPPLICQLFHDPPPMRTSLMDAPQVRAIPRPRARRPLRLHAREAQVQVLRLSGGLRIGGGKFKHCQIQGGNGKPVYVQRARYL